MKLDKELINKPITGENLEKEVSYFEPEFVQNRCRTPLNGNWKFIYADDFDEVVLDPNFDISELNDIVVPSHIELNGYGTPKYCNVQYPWEGTEEVKLGDVPKKNKVGIYIKDIDVILEDKVRNIETICKMLDTQADIVRQTLKSGMESDSKLVDDL